MAAFGENLELYGKPPILKPNEYENYHMYLHLKENVTEALRNYLSELTKNVWDDVCFCQANKEDGSFLMEIPDLKQELVARFKFKAEDCVIFHVKETLLFVLPLEHILMRCGGVRRDGCPDALCARKKDRVRFIASTAEDVDIG